MNLHRVIHRGMLQIEDFIGIQTKNRNLLLLFYVTNHGIEYRNEVKDRWKKEIIRLLASMVTIGHRSVRDKKVI